MEGSGETLDSYIKRMQDQELKGLLLKLKNELRKEDASWEGVRSILESLYRKNSGVFSEVAPLIIK
jgi:hypothetical protein